MKFLKHSVRHIASSIRFKSPEALRIVNRLGYTSYPGHHIRSVMVDGTVSSNGKSCGPIIGASTASSLINILMGTPGSFAPIRWNGITFPLETPKCVE